MSFSVKKTIFKTLKIGGITIVSFFALLFLLPILFPKTISSKIKQYANQSISGSLAFSNTRLSFFKHFPSLTLTLYDVSLKGSAPFEKDTLIAAKEISFGLDLTSVFKKKITINKIYFDKALINIQADSLGHVNYNVYKSKPSAKASPNDTSSASLGINQILIEHSKFVYNDESIPVKFVARDFNYDGKGDLAKDVFDLYTHTEMASVDFYYDKRPYVLSKSVKADLITKINTKSLAFVFQKNDLRINKLPVQFIGKFGFLKSGFEMDFKINSHETDLHDMMTVLPPEYLKWLEKTEVKGIGNLQFRLAGKYIASQGIMPDLSLSVKVRNGYINNQKSPVPITNLYLNFETKMPQLDQDSLQFNMDSLYFNMGKDYFSSTIKINGVKKPDILAKINTEIDLEKWSSAFGVKPFTVKGQYSLHMLAKGKYTTGVKHRGIRQVDTVITNIPKFSIKSSLTNGYFKYASLPEAMTNIGFNLNAACADNDVNHAYFEIKNLNINALDNYIKGHFKAGAASGYPMDGSLLAKFNLSELKKFYPIKKGITLSGMLNGHLETKGRYLPAKHIFPVSNATISLQNGYIQTKYYPHPIKNININTSISSTSGSLSGLSVHIKPVSFVFEGQPFSLTADLKNFNDLNYNISSHGTLDIGKIYRVFAIKDYNVRGLIIANVSLKGKQSDAKAGNYAALNNSGTMLVKDLVLTSDLFPKPFLITTGKFSFTQDKMQFDAFSATYGKSVIVLNGALSNVLGYATKPGDALNGDLNFVSNSITADDFMAFSSPSPTKSGKSASGPSGVILVPKNLDLTFTADVKKVKYNGIDINDVKGQMQITNGSIILKQTGFNIIGAPVTMDATYTANTPKSANFDYHISAQEFDIKKAYDQIKLFRDMATSAKGMEGVIGLDYKLTGRLNANMQPVYPSLAGGGILSVKKVKVKGFKLFGAVGAKTDHKGIDSGDVSKVNIETTIANNIITIKQTKIRMAGFRLRFNGQVSFDNALNLHFRLGLPPLGIFGIPMTITGTQAKPKIHLGNGKKEDELQGEADTDPEK